MIYNYFFVKCVLKWSENSVRYLKILWELTFRKAIFSEILSHSVRYGMCDLTDFVIFIASARRFCIIKVNLNREIH